MAKEKSKELKLKIELVPKPLWYNNLRNRMERKDWDRIRKQTYADFGYKCGICGEEGRLNCHEIWEYNDTKYVQKLLGFIALCDLCHHIKHIGLAGILAERGELDYEKVVEHFKKVNNCGRNTFAKHKRETFTQWEERSSHKWQVDLGEYANFIKGKPE